MRGVGLAVAAAVLFVGLAVATAAEVRDVGGISLTSVALPESATRDGGDADIAAPLASAIGVGGESSLRFLRSTALPNKRGRSLRYSQLYRGVPIWDQQVVVRQATDGKLTDASGTAVFGIAAAKVAPPSPGISADQALQVGIATVASKVRKRPARIETPTAELVYRVDESQELELVYKVSFFTTVHDAEGPRPTRPLIFVDANSGAIVDRLENIQFAEPGRVLRAGTGRGGNERVGRYRFGSGIFPKFIVTVRDDGVCAMDSPFLQTEDLEHQLEGNGEPYTFPCFNNVDPTINGGYGPLNDAHSFGQVVYDLYQDWYGIAPLPGKLLQRAHYDDGYDRAFWNGEAMYYGDGKSLFYPVVALDVAGHEISHGFTERHSGLIYENQSGAMNEAFSDMAGQVAMAYFAARYGQPFKYTIPNFRIGTSIWKIRGKSYRYMCTPPVDGRSIDHVRDYKDGMDVHFSSGIYNKAFCQLAHSEGWSVRKAFEIFLVANESHWTPRATFESGARDVLRAATLLGYRTDAVTKAFAKVGVELPMLRVGEPTRALSATGGGLDTRTARIPLSAPAGVSWDVAGVPRWLRVSQTNGFVRGEAWLELSLTSAAKRLPKSTTAVLTFYNDTQPGQTPIKRKVRIIIVDPRQKFDSSQAGE